MAVAWIIFACAFGGSLFGMLLRATLPDHHLSDESKDVIKLACALIATMTALVLGLLIASAKGRYDQAQTEVIDLSANILLLDSLLAHYGPETKDIRAMLHDVLAGSVDRIWVQDNGASAHPRPISAEADEVIDRIEQLKPANDTQRALQADCRSQIATLVRTRMLLFEQTSSSIPFPFLVVVVFWLTILFISFGLFAPFNTTVIGTLLVCAMSVAGAMFLVLELEKPFTGIIQISRAPVVHALDALGR
jgi:uncharacterized protein DUF4239